MTEYIYEFFLVSATGKLGTEHLKIFVYILLYYDSLYTVLGHKFFLFVPVF